MGDVKATRGHDLLAALAEGPARLSSDQVAASQHRRMLAAMVTAVAEKGFVRVAVADVTQRAHVSRATFYEHFADKTDCFIAAFHACVERFVDALRDYTPPRLAPRERLHCLLENYLGSLAAFPEGARVCLVEIYAAGAEAVLHRKHIQLDFAALLRELHQALAAAGEPVWRLSDLDFELLVGAISAQATNITAMGEVGRLPELLEPLESFVLTTFGLHAPR